MTYDTYRAVFFIAAVGAGAAFLTAIVLFFALRIPRVLGYLTGSAQRRAVARIRSETAVSGRTAMAGSHAESAAAPAEASSAASGGSSSAGSSSSAKGNAARPHSARIALGEKGSGPSTSKLTTGEFPARGEETTLLQKNKPPRQREIPPGEESAPLAGPLLIEREITFLHTDEFIPPPAHPGY